MGSWRALVGWPVCTVDAPNASWRALCTSPEAAEVRDTCVPPRNTRKAPANPRELTTYGSQARTPIQHIATRYTLAYTRPIRLGVVLTIVP